MRKQFALEDYAMIFQWVCVVLIAPLVLLPIFPAHQFSLTTRLLIVIIGCAGSLAMTGAYLLARRRSKNSAALVATVTAGLDATLILLALLFWPTAIPEAFWLLAVLVVVISARFGYKAAAIAMFGISAIYLVTVIANLNIGPQPARTLLAAAIARIVLLFILVTAAAYVTQRERLQRREARVLSRVAAAIGSTLDADELTDIVVEGVSEVGGLGRTTAFEISKDGRWAVPKSSTETNREARQKIFTSRMDLQEDNAASRVMETREPVFIEDASSDALVDPDWVTEFGLRTLMVLPVISRDEVKGIVIVERRGLKRYFTERQVEVCNAILAQASAGLENAARYAEEHRRRSEADTLYRASRELASSLDLDQVLENACRLAARSTGASGCSAFLLNEASGCLEPRLMFGSGARRTSFPPDSGIPIDAFEEMYILAQRPQALRLARPEDNPSLPRFLRVSGSLLVAPFYIRGGVGGLLCVNDNTETEYSDAQAGQLALVANETALAVINARLHEKIKTNATQMASLVQLANAIGSTAELATIASLALESVRHLFDCSAGLIYRIDEKQGVMRCVESFGYTQDVLERISRPPYPRVEDCWTVSEGRLIGIDDLSETKVACRTLEKIGQGSTMCVGMQAEGRTLGVMHVRSERPNAFGEEDQQLALAFADQVGLALQRAFLFEEINRLAMTDPLTGVFNVRRLEEVLADELGRARRYKRAVSFLMVDVDNLKSYNDTLGHQQGDIVLSQVASIVDSSTREMDRVFRYGGDEFCVILPETDSDEAAVVAEKVRRAVADFHFAGEEKVPDGSITISVGVASFPRDCDEEAGLIHKADLALYAAKQIGRNSVATAF